MIKDRVFITFTPCLWRIITKSVDTWTVDDVKPADSYFFLIRYIMSKKRKETSYK